MKGDRNIPFGRPWTTDEDRQAVLEVLEGPILTHGPQCKEFEASFAQFVGDDAHCVTVSSCMAALHLSYLYFGIGPGDEVIVPAQTHTATAHAAEMCGATVVFVDCDRDTGNLSAEAVAAAITPRTKAISVVHFLGIPCTMPEIADLAAQHKLKVIEDCALAVGSRYDGRHVGMFGDAGCFSFYPVKHMTTGEGGMFISQHREVVDGVARLRAFGVDRTHVERKIPGMYDVPILGLNYRMSEMQAALGRTQLNRMDECLAHRKANFNRLKESLNDVPNVRVLDATVPEAVNTHYCLSTVLDGDLATRRDAIVARLNAAGVGTSIYYPQPVPRMTYYQRKYGYEADRFQTAAQISDHSVALPVGPHVSQQDIDYIAACLRSAIEEEGSCPTDYAGAASS